MTNVKSSLQENKEKPQNVSIYKVLSPLQWFLKISAASCYYQNAAGEYKRSFLLLIYTIIYFIGNLYFGQFVFHKKNYYANRNSFKFAFYLEKLPYFTVAISVVFGQILSGRKIQSLKLLEEIDKVFLTTDQREKILKANSKIKSLYKKLIITAIVSLLLYGVATYFVITGERVITQFLAIYYFTIVTSIVQPIEFAVMCYCIRSRFKIINEVVKEKIEESERVDKYPINKHFFIRRLKLLLDQHEKLRHVAAVTNSAFSIQLFCFSLTVLAVFISKGIKIIIVIFDGGDDKFLLILTWTTAIIFYVEGLTIICHHVNGLTTQANYTIRLLHGIQLRIDDTESIKMMILSTMHLDNNKVKLSACKLFKVDFSLLLYICGGAMSYLVITYQFVQFKEIQKERRIAMSHLNNVTSSPTEPLFYYSTTEM